MRKLLIILFAIISATAGAQGWEMVYKIDSLHQAFGTAIGAGKMVFCREDTALYCLKKKVSGFDSLAGVIARGEYTRNAAGGGTGGGGGDTYWTESGGLLQKTNPSSAFQVQVSFDSYMSSIDQNWDGVNLQNIEPIYRVPLPGFSVGSISDSIRNNGGENYHVSAVNLSSMGPIISEYYNGQESWFGLSSTGAYEGSLIGQSGVNHGNRMNLGHSGVPFGVAYLDSAHVNGTVYANAIQITKSGRAPASTFAGIDPYGNLKDKYIIPASPVRVTEIGDTSMISMAPAGTGTDGYLDSASYDRFNNKVSSPFTFDSTFNSQTISRTAPADLALELKSTGEDSESLLKFENTGNTAFVGIYGPAHNGLSLNASAGNPVTLSQNNVLKAQVTGAGDFSVTNGLNVGGTVTGSKMVGGTAVGSTLTLQSTTGAGTPTDVGVQVAVGTDGATKAITVLNDGNVGIGTSTPVAKLDVEGTSYPVFQTKRTTTLTGGSIGTQSSTGLASSYVLTTHTSGNMTDGFGGGLLFYMSDNTYKNNPTNAQVRLYAQRDGADTQGTLGIYTSSTENYPKMIIRASGNVGIGTTNPTAKLHVANGTIKVTGTGSDSTTLSTAKGLRLYGDAVAWDDLVFGFSTGVNGVAAYPAFNADSMYWNFTVDSTGPSQCKKYYTVQIPHRAKEGNITVYPHVHYRNATTNGTPVFIIKYRWYNIGETPGAWSWRRLTQTTGTTDGTHSMNYSNLGITKANSTLSSIIDMQVYLYSQTGTGGINAMQVDLHFPIDKIGSDNEYTNN